MDERKELIESYENLPGFAKKTLWEDWDDQVKKYLEMDLGWWSQKQHFDSTQMKATHVQRRKGLM